MGTLGGPGSCRWENSSLMNHPDSTRAYSSASEAHIRLSPPGKKPELRPQNQKAPPFFCMARSFIHAFIYTCRVGGAVSHMGVNELQSSPEGPYDRCWKENHTRAEHRGLYSRGEIPSGVSSGDAHPPGCLVGLKVEDLNTGMPLLKQ